MDKAAERRIEIRLHNTLGHHRDAITQQDSRYLHTWGTFLHSQNSQQPFTALLQLPLSPKRERTASIDSDVDGGNAAQSADARRVHDGSNDADEHSDADDASSSQSSGSSDESGDSDESSAGDDGRGETTRASTEHT